MSQESSNDPLEFVRNMWKGMGFNLPGMVTPTMDVDELDKRITDMKAVEGWLKMNLNMLQMSIQGLEMQRATLMTIKHMGDAARRHAEGAPEPEEQMVNPFAGWPWMQQAETEPEPPEEDASEDDTPAQNTEAAAKAAQAAGDAANAFATAAAAATNAAASAAMWPFQVMEHAGKDAEPKAPAKKAPARKSASTAKRTTAAKPAAKKPAPRKTTTAAKKPASTAKRTTGTTSTRSTTKK